MTEVTEYGDIMAFGSPAILDEWGRRKIDALLEDATFIIVVVVPPPPPPVRRFIGDGLVCVVE